MPRFFRWGGGGGGGNASIRNTPSPTDTALLVPEDAESADNSAAALAVQHPAATGNLFVEIPRSPPSYDGEEGGAAAAQNPDDDDGEPVPDPPSYTAATKLPTYDEAERAKDGAPLETGDTLQLPPMFPGRLTLVPISADEDPEASLSSTRDSSPMGDTALLGNDFIFFTAFITAFLFNWIGFLLLMCFCHTIAARYGALAGFGLSLTKWTLIIKKSSDFAVNAAFSDVDFRGGGGGGNHHRSSSAGVDRMPDNHHGVGIQHNLAVNNNADSAWLWWLIMGFGMLICVRAVLQYMRIKRSWMGLSNAARERLFFFY